MYNEDRKIQFIEETRNSEDFGRSVFRTTEPYEIEADKDLCEFQTEALQSIMNKNFGARTRSVDKTIAFLRMYVLWCKEQGYRTNDGIYSVKAQMDEKMKRYMVASPKHLQAVLDEAFPPVESKTVDCIYRCYLWMSFAGFDEHEPLEVRVDEVDFTSMLIEHAGKSYEIYREAIPAFRVACEATEFKYENPNYKKGPQMRSRFPGEYLMRGIRSGQVKIATAKSFIQKAFKNSDIELTYNKIRMSGMFYRAYEAERMGEPVNFDSFIAEQVINRKSEYHNNYTRGKVAGYIKRDLLDDYACWKAVFT